MKRENTTVVLKNKIPRETTESQNKPFPEIKSEHLFSEYNHIKKQLQTNPIDKEQLEQRRIELRNEIAVDNIALIIAIIDRRLKGKYKLNKIHDKVEIEDLYQIGYEVLLHYIDSHYLDKETFKNNLIKLLMIYIQRISDEQDGLGQHNIKELTRIKDILISESDISIEELSEKTNIQEERIKNLLNLNNIINSLSLDEILDNLDEQPETKTALPDYTLSLYSDTLEEDLYRKLQREYLMNLIDTLPSTNQKNTIILLFGLNGEKEHTQEEIATKLGITTRAVQHLKTRALENLSQPMRLKYLSQIYDNYSQNNIQFDSEEIFSYLRNQELKQLERLLFKHVKKEKLLKILNLMHPKFKETLIIYLGLDKVSSSDVENNQHQDNYYNDYYIVKREKALIHLRQQLTKLYVDNNPNEDIKDYIDYLMYNYLTKTRKKTSK